MRRFVSVVLASLAVAGCEVDRPWVDFEPEQDCASCEIRTDPVWRSGSGNADVNYPTSVLVSDRGVVVSEFLNHRVVLFGSAGETVKVVAGPGEGPGEVFGVSGAAMLDDGGLVIVARNRVSVFDEHLEFSHSFQPHVPVAERSFAVVDDSTVVIAGRSYGVGSGRFTQHAYALDGRLRHSFDSLSEEGSATFGAAPNGNLWHRSRAGSLAEPPQFHLSLWDPQSGRRLQELRREPPWLTSWEPEAWEVAGEHAPQGRVVPLRPGVGPMWQGDDSVLWVVTHVPDPEYRRDPRRSSWSRFTDSILEAIDPESGYVFAAKRFDARIAAFTNRGEIVLWEQDELGVPTLEVHAVHLWRP